MVLPDMHGSERGSFPGTRLHSRRGDPAVYERRLYARFIHVIESCSTVAIDTQMK